MTIQPPLVVIKYPFSEVQDGGGHDCGGSGGMAWWGVGAAPSGETINIIEKYTKKRNGLPTAGENAGKGRKGGRDMGLRGRLLEESGEGERIRFWRRDSVTFLRYLGKVVVKVKGGGKSTYFTMALPHSFHTNTTSVHRVG